MKKSQPAVVIFKDGAKRSSAGNKGPLAAGKGKTSYFPLELLDSNTALPTP